MHLRLYTFLEENQILCKNQFGFKKKSSCAHSLIEITEKIKESIDNGRFGCGIFIDLKKAFDTVNHDILLLKLEHYGVLEGLPWNGSNLTSATGNNMYFIMVFLRQFYRLLAVYRRVQSLVLYYF